MKYFLSFLRASNLLFLLVFLPLLLVGQSDNETLDAVYTDMMRAGLYEGVPYYALNSSNSIKVNGSTYVDADWQDGVILTLDSEKYRIKGRYNAELNEIHILVKGEVRKIFAYMVKAVTVDNRIYYPTNFYDKEEVMYGFLEVVTAGDYNLFIRRIVKKEAVSEHPLLGASVSSKYKITIRETLYYSKGKEYARKLKTGKKNILRLFDKFKNKIITHVDKHKLGYRSKEDLTMLFQKYNALNEDKQPEQTEPTDLSEEEKK